MLFDREDSARLEAGVDLREVRVLRIAAHPTVEYARGEHEIEFVRRQRRGLRTPVHEIDLAVDGGVRVLGFEVRAALAGVVRQRRIPEVGRGGVELTFREARIGREDLRPPATARLQLEDSHAGLEAPE